ncbi:enoyl-CoA hydratase-related protein [Nocardioides sp.]|uniref:enoyl-CoA hydratase-related protein n=1 Tax=Nocardioides sp. TaxID=35761 RepID=UPI00260BE454|nr:enoyl-CoA hydratase-related protein [Nocardioides sp.]MDI6912488.1 enoyl-CoA hydratase-related protein [Nocardioides sp.]
MSEIQVTVSDHVATLTLMAGYRRNALTSAMARELIDALGSIDADPEIGAVVIRGDGGSFCAGADLGTLAAAGSDPAGSETFRDIGVVYEAFVRFGQLKAPTVAAIRGAAVGAGMNLALAADLRIVALDARLMSGFLRIGVHPGGGHFALMNRVAGREASAAMGLFSQTINGEDAVRVGLAWEAVDDAEVESRAIELAKVVAADPDLARATAATFRLEAGPPALSWEAGLAVERATQMWTFRRRGERAGHEH